MPHYFSQPFLASYWGVIDTKSNLSASIQVHA
ncbi:hypothetical protein CPS_1643 [Colwellia psychrerythraea 34H]|uniref:Uncharacterized protein n=1 Tax=Colwellia psychrerythraea (strain 34H / ATCC BAA-681) TaxID=167879 RepID=Q484Y4_COLP3|nr:hypothetical protein CPS_1643 [Colwellia psychrerythraea 34H]